MGRTLQDYVMAEERHLPFKDTRQMETAPSMEHRAPTKVQPVELIAWKATFFIFQFILVNFSYTPQSFQFTLVKFRYNTF